ncbi:MAG: hypothetical protein AAB353_03460, partial [Candidatus Hydrogenedentota bacterium]
VRVVGDAAGAEEIARRFAHAPRLGLCCVLAPDDAMPGPLVGIAIAVAAIFAIVHGLEIFLRFDTPDWSLARLTKDLPSQEELGLSAPIPPAFLIFASSLITLVLGVVLYGAIALPAEYAWRVFLPAALGTRNILARALIVGPLWAAWLAPLAFVPPGVVGPWQTIMRGIVIAILVSIVAEVVFARTGHLALTAVLAGSFASQCEVSIYYFLLGNRIEPINGALGYIAIFVWSIIAFVVWKKFRTAARPVPAKL